MLEPVLHCRPNSTVYVINLSYRYDSVTPAYWLGAVLAFSTETVPMVSNRWRQIKLLIRMSQGYLSCVSFVPGATVRPAGG